MTITSLHFSSNFTLLLLLELLITSHFTSCVTSRTLGITSPRTLFHFVYHFNACANSPPTRLQFELYLTPWFTALYVHPTSCHFDYHFKAFFTSPRTSLPSAAVCASSTTPLTVFSSSLHHPLPSPTPLTHSPHPLPSRTPLTPTPLTQPSHSITLLSYAPHTIHTALSRITLFPPPLIPLHSHFDTLIDLTITSLHFSSKLHFTTTT